MMNEFLVLRLGEKGAFRALKQPGARPIDFTGKPMKTMVHVEPKAYRSEKRLREWIALAVNHTRTLPDKEKK